jgi:HEAT repeat protein
VIRPFMSNDHVEEAVKRRLLALRQNDWAGANQAAEELAALGKAAVSILIEALSDRNAKVREVVAMALGKIRDPQAAPALERALRNEQLAPENEEGDDTDARAGAALAIGAIGDASAFEPLTAMLAEALETDWTLSWYIIDALGMLGDTRAVPLLVDALEHPDFDVQKSAMHALVSFGQVAVAPLVDIALDKDSRGRTLAVRALGAIGAPRAAPALARVIKDHGNHPFLRAGAALALGQVGADEAYSLLFQLFKSTNEDENVRRCAAVGLGHLGDRRALEPFLAALEDADWPMRHSLAEALGHLGDRRAIELLIKLLRDRRDEVVLQAAQALGKLGALQAVPELTWLQSHCEDRFLKDMIKHSVAESIKMINEQPS